MVRLVPLRGPGPNRARPEAHHRQATGSKKGIAFPMGADPILVTLARLQRHWRGFWPGCDAGALAADVRIRLSQGAAAWDLRDPRPVGGGCVALVCIVARNEHELVVKVSPRGHSDDEMLAAEGEALSFWRSTGAVVELIDRRDDGLTLLMERLRPGDSLDDAGLTWDEQLSELGRLAARLQSARRPPASTLHMHDYVDHWRHALAGESALLEELEALSAPANGDVLIHGDLHGGNVVRDGRAWKVIDPHGVRADRNAEIWALLSPDTPVPDSGPAAAKSVRDWVERYAAAAGLDPARAATWTRLRARAEALDVERLEASTGEELAWAVRLHRIADALG